MPIKAGKSRKVISSNISELMEAYSKTGRIGSSKPASRKKALKQAEAIALSTARLGQKRPAR